MIFFIAFQQTRLKVSMQKVLTKKQELKTLKVNTPNLHKALEDVKIAYDIFKFETKKPNGNLKSFIPFTAAFKTRIEYSKKRNEAVSQLKLAEKSLFIALKKNDGEVPLALNKKKLGIRRTKSLDTTPPALPKIYPSPLNIKPGVVSKESEDGRSNGNPSLTRYSADDMDVRLIFRKCAFN